MVRLFCILTASLVSATSAWSQERVVGASGVLATCVPTCFEQKKSMPLTEVMRVCMIGFILHPRWADCSEFRSNLVNQIVDEINQ